MYFIHVNNYLCYSYQCSVTVTKMYKCIEKMGTFYTYQNINKSLNKADLFLPGLDEIKKRIRPLTMNPFETICNLYDMQSLESHR